MNLKHVVDTMCCASGSEVEKEMCADAVYPAPVSCKVPCPKDCALSLWTEWSTCSQTCSSKTAEGKQMRTRAILAYNAGEGTENITWVLACFHFSSAKLTQNPNLNIK